MTGTDIKHVGYVSLHFGASEPFVSIFFSAAGGGGGGAKNDICFSSRSSLLLQQAPIFRKCTRYDYCWNIFSQQRCVLKEYSQSATVAQYRQ